MARVQPTSRTAALLEDVRRMPLFRQLAPMESGIGWPIPVRHRPGWTGGTVVYLRLPLFGFQPEPDGTRPVAIFPPFATLTLDWANGRPMEFADLRYTRPWPMQGRPSAVGEFPHEAVRAAYSTVNDYVKARNRLLELYDALFDAQRDEHPFAESGEFADLLGTLIEPSLLPYYRAIGGRFVERFLGPGPSAAE